MMVCSFWRRLTATRYTRALEAALARERSDVARQCAEMVRLRAENRALLNSILGIAGLPPVPACEADLAAVAPAPAVVIPRRSAAPPGNLSSAEREGGGCTRREIPRFRSG